MTIKLFHSSTSTWKIAKRLRVFQSSTSNWLDPKKVSVWRDPDNDDIGYWDIAYPDLPMASGPVSIQGSAGVGSILTLSDSTPWIDEEYVKVNTTTYQWARSLQSGGSYINIPSATSGSYTVRAEDEDYYFICKITGTNEKGSTIVTSSQSNKVVDPSYTFYFGNSLGVNPNAFIMFEEQAGGGFPATNLLLVAGKVFAYLFGDYTHYDLLYKSDLSTFRIYHRLYRSDRSQRPDNPDIEYEIVFTSGSDRIDLYVINPVSQQYIQSYSAYLDDYVTYKQYAPYAEALLWFYYSGRKYSVYANSTSAILNSEGHASTAIQISSISISNGVATFTTSEPHNIIGRVYIYGLTGNLDVFNGNNYPSVPTSNTFRISTSLSNGTYYPSGARVVYTPSFLTGWIYIGSQNDSGTIPVTFTSGSGISSPITSTLNGAFTKSNMFYPSFVTVSTPIYLTSSSAYVSWSGSNANSYSVRATRSDNTSVNIFGPVNTTSTGITINNLTVGVSYNIYVTPNSRSDYQGQFGFTSGSINYSHATVPNAPTSVSGTKGNAQVSLTWTAPSSNGSAITGYKVRYSSNGGVSWSTPTSTGSTANAYTVTGLTNGTSYIFQVLATNSVGDGPWSSSSASIVPEVVATKISVTASPTTILTLSETSTFTAQLQDSSGNSISKSGVSITFTGSSLAGGSIDTTSATTDANGRATTKYTSSSSSGNPKVTASSTGLTSGSATITVNLRTGITPSLSASGNNKGVSFTNTNHNTSYTYSLNSGPTAGSLETGDSYNNSQFDILTTRTRSARPDITVNRTAKTATTSNTTFNANQSVSLSIKSSRSGYTTVNSNTATATASIGISSRSYAWQFSTDGGTTWRTDWPSAFRVGGVNTWTTQTLKWTGTPNSRRIRCDVTTNFQNGSSDTSRTNTPNPTIP